MPFRPAPNSQLTIRNHVFTVCEHPAAPGMAYGQSGRRALVYQLRDESGRYFALKVFNQTFRTVEIEQSAKNLQSYASLPGLEVCQRVVLTDPQDTALLQQYPDLRYAVQMPWVLGRTWQEVILERIAFKPRESFQFANSLVNILAGMERAGLAHCDLSGANVLLPGLFNHQPPVALVDVEEMYLPGAQTPSKLPAGTPGYNHKTAVSGLWGAEVDRFAGAILITEMLGWFDAQVRQAALNGQDGSGGEQYFASAEMQKPCLRFDVLHKSLATNWSAGIAVLLERSWNSATLKECPSFDQWQNVFTMLPSRLPVLEEMSQPVGTTSHPVIRWKTVTGGTDSTGQMIGGRYKILELFSDGGFGTVYLAADLRDNSRCVLKKNKDVSDEGRRQFAREAELLRRLKHPNLVKVLDYLDSPGDGQFIVMEMIQGDDLQTLITRHGAVPLAPTLLYLEQICNALNYLHSQNPPIIHRDVKPANIRITADGRAVLMDFGIAKTIAPDVRTTIGARAVSPGFSPPEQYGQNNTDVRADVYAFGATIWALLTGRPPQESVDRMSRDNMFPLNGALSPSAEQALRCALDLDPARRFASVHEFWQTFTSGLQRQEVFTPPITDPIHLKQPGRRTPAWVFALAVVAVVVIGAAFLWPKPPVGNPTPTFALIPTNRVIATVSTPIPPTITLVPSETITPSPIGPTSTLTITPTPTKYQCPDMARLQLALNRKGKVQKSGVKLLKEPGVTGETNVIRTLIARENIRVIGLPQCVNNMTWWNIITESSTTGWTQEIDPVLGRLLGLRNP